MPTPLQRLAPSPSVRAHFEALAQREVVLRVEHLTKVFSSPQGETCALRDVSFEAHRREFLCVIGASGCGKSTLIRILAGLEQPTSGRVVVGGQEVQGPGPDRGMVFQQYTLFPWLSVKRNIMFGLERRGLDSHTADREARQWIDLVGLGPFQDAYPRQLSGGMQQRVAIARALANQPQVLLMDEPFSALDSQTRARLQRHLLEIWHNVNLTIVFITHDLDEATYLADRILVLRAHPGEVEALIEVPVCRPRSPEQFLSPEFLATKQSLEQLIHSDDDEIAPPPMVRLTRVGDEAF